MMRKSTYLLLSLALVVVLLMGGLQSAPTLAAGPTKAPTPDFPISLELDGIIQTLTTTQLLLSDGTSFKVVESTKVDANLQTGAQVTVVAEFDTDEFIAKSITASSAADTSNGGNGQGNGGNGQGNGGNGQGN